MPSISILIMSLLLIFSTAQAEITCEGLTELGCINSAACTLEKSGSEYQCRTAINDCEKGFIQRVDGVSECESKQGCIYQPQNCYCPPDVICRCGGGKPSSCNLEANLFAP